MPKIIVLTGSTKGCGQALALAFAAEGHTVIGCARTAKAVQNLSQKLGKPHDISCVDVSSEESVSPWATRVLREFGVPDYVINNAAIINHNAPLWSIPQNEFDQVIDINIKGTANVLRNFLPAMTARKKGVIVNFSSSWGRSTSPEVSAYCASKWAIEGLTQALSQELPRGMAAVALNPGIINTEMLRSCFASGAAHYPTPDVWVKSAAPFILSLTEKNNGQSLDVPGAAMG